MTTNIEAATDAQTSLRAANIARDKEWNTGSEKVSLAFRGNELAGEVGEACNVMKKLERERIGIRGSRATKEQLAEELADVVICADLIAMDEGIDLDAAVVAKFNSTSIKYALKTRMSAALQPVGVEEIRAAFQPFATDADIYDDQGFCDSEKSFKDNITVGDLRRARAALTPKNGEPTS
jgi:NTP pyrophosphatase (non-canonical NTP hydrolase)